MRSTTYIRACSAQCLRLPQVAARPMYLAEFEIDVGACRRNVPMVHPSAAGAIKVVPGRRTKGVRPCIARSRRVPKAAEEPWEEVDLFDLCQKRRVSRSCHPDAMRRPMSARPIREHRPALLMST